MLGFLQQRSSRLWLYSHQHADLGVVKPTHMTGEMSQTFKRVCAVLWNATPARSYRMLILCPCQANKGLWGLDRVTISQSFSLTDGLLHRVSGGNLIQSVSARKIISNTDCKAAADRKQILGTVWIVCLASQCGFENISGMHKDPGRKETRLALFQHQWRNLLNCIKVLLSSFTPTFR